MTLIFPLCDTSNKCECHLVGAVTEGFAGHVGGQTVEDQISAGRAGGDGAVVGIKGHTGHIFFVVLSDREGSSDSPSDPILIKSTYTFPIMHS